MAAAARSSAALDAVAVERKVNGAASGITGQNMWGCRHVYIRGSILLMYCS